MLCVHHMRVFQTTTNVNSNGLNILPVYTDYFHLNAATEGLQTASVFIGGCLAPPVWGILTDAVGRRPAMLWAAVIALVGVILQSAAQVGPQTEEKYEESSSIVTLEHRYVRHCPDIHWLRYNSKRTDRAGVSC